MGQDNAPRRSEKRKDRDTHDRKNSRKYSWSFGGWNWGAPGRLFFLSFLVDSSSNWEQGSLFLALMLYNPTNMLLSAFISPLYFTTLRRVKVNAWYASFAVRK